MSNKTNIFIVPALILWIFLAGYYAYRSWFDINGLRKSMQRDIEKLPSWYPTREYSLSKINTKGWVWQIRILSSIGTIIGLVGLVLSLYVLFR